MCRPPVPPTLKNHKAGAASIPTNPWMGGKGGMIGANVPWYDALDRPGAFQMQFMRRLFESVPFQNMVPDQSIILNGPTTGGAKIRAVRSFDSSFAIIYSPFGESFTLNKNLVKAQRFKEIWYDPRYGISYEIAEPQHWGIQTYAPPTSGRGQDWVLLIEDAAKNYPLPDAR
jgi:hypothetical protein